MIRVHGTLQTQVLHCIVMHDRFYVVDQLGRGGGECEGLSGNNIYNYACGSIL